MNGVRKLGLIMFGMLVSFDARLSEAGIMNDHVDGEG